MMFGARARTFAACLAAAGIATMPSACSSYVPGGAQPSEIDVRKLDVGKYPTEPLDIHVDYPPNSSSARQIGGVRLGDHVASAYDIDPHLVVGMHSAAFYPGFMPDQLGHSDDMSAVAKREHMLFGFESQGADRQSYLSSYDWPEPSSPRATVVDLMVMQFPDAGSAEHAAGDFYDTDFRAYQDRNQPVPLRKYPDAHAHWRPGTASLRAFLAHGAYVVGLLVETPTADVPSLTALAEQAYDTQLPLLDQYPPMVDEDMLRVSWDPDYLLSRALNPDASGYLGYADDNTAFGFRAMVNYAENRDLAKQNFAAIGADEFAKTSDAFVARAADPTAARRAVADRLGLEPAGRPADAPPNVPDSACMENQDDDRSRGRKRFTCIVAYRRYVAYVQSNQLADAHQRAAAQYALLANSQWEP
jgi:hypothetical protein